MLTLTHIHLLLNHFPTIGFTIGLGLFLSALISKSQDLTRASLAVFVGIAIMTIPTYVSGNAALASVVKEGASKDLIAIHEGAALIAFSLIEVTGGVALLALWHYRKTKQLSGVAIAAVLVMSLASMAFVARAANIGGEIRHSEIREAEMPSTFEGPLARSVGNYVKDHPFMWVTSETLHFIGLTLLMGSVLLMNFRMLGFISGIPVAAIGRLLPWGMLGFGLNLITGMLFFVAAPDQYIENIAFLWKVIAAVLALGNALYFTVFDRSWELAPNEPAQPLSKLMAVSALGLWVVVMYYGSMLPFIGNAF